MQVLHYTTKAATYYDGRLEKRLLSLGVSPHFRALDVHHTFRLDYLTKGLVYNDFDVALREKELQHTAGPFNGLDVSNHI